MTESSSPEFARLLDGYRRFRANAWSPNRERWKQLREGQKPAVMVIACSDSRVDPAQIFDVDPGEIFVVRNVAAMVPPFETTPGHHGVSAALEFAVQVLEVKEIVVMGHGMCGGCKVGADPRAARYRAGRRRLHRRLDRAARRSARADRAPTMAPRAARPSGRWSRPGSSVSLRNLRSFPCIRRKERDGELKLRGAFFAISDGVLHVLDEASGVFNPIE